MKDIIETKREFFKSNKTKDIKFRIEALKKFKITIIKYEQKILNAIKKDLSRSDFVTYTAEINPILEEIDFFINNLKSLTKPKHIKTPKLQIGYKAYEIKSPLGVVFIISPWNYPFMSTFIPFVGSIASGNTTIMKPSEYSSNSSNVIKNIVEDTFTSNFAEVILGEGEIATNIIENKVDFIFFTGSTKIGKIIMKNASLNLTPVCLELGGKSPCIIDESANIDICAKRLVWGKTLNAGQTCIAPDYAIVHKKIYSNLVEKMIYYTKEFWGENPLKNLNYPKMIHKKAFTNTLKLIENENILYGGNYDENTLKIEPTYINCQNINTQIMQTEIFAPILPIITYNNKSEIYNIIEKNDTPLALYIFSSNKLDIKEYTENISFGGCSINDTIMQIDNNNLGFGGIGTSGMGRYHTIHSFNLFSNIKSISKAPTILDISLKYPHKENLSKFKKLSK